MTSCRGLSLTRILSWIPRIAYTVAPGTGWGGAGPAARAPYTIQHDPKYPAPEVSVHFKRLRKNKDCIDVNNTLNFL